MYEVDNRYPEVAEPYEKVRGVRHHGGVPLGGPGFSAAKRAVRINNLKRSFWTSAAAVVTVICLLLVSPSRTPEEPPIPTESVVIPTETETLPTEPPTEPVTETPEPVTESSAPTDAPETEESTEPFVAPSLSVAGAALNGSDVTPLRYSCGVTLNSAESLRVTAAITDQSGASLGSDGPYDYTSSGTSPEYSAALSWSTRPSTVTLTLTGTYVEAGEEKQITASQTLNVPEEPFLAPTLTITEAALNGTGLTPLRYRYRVDLNSAESLRVTAEITDQSGARLGSGGPFSHTGSGLSPARSTALRWSARPSSVTLTLTGTYTEKGRTRTITAKQTLTVAEASFVTPTLNIASAALNGSDVTPLRYSYSLKLNSAASLRVTAAVTDQAGRSLGSGGPWEHAASGSSPTRSTTLGWTARPTSVTLTLTGRYQDQNGKEQTVTASQTLAVPEEPFTAPTLRIASAALNGADVTPLRYSYSLKLNSAASLRVTAAVTDQAGRSLGSGGPWTHSASGSSPTRTTALSWSTRPGSVILTLTGTYDEKGTTKTVTASQTLPVPEEPFITPTLRIVSAALNDPDLTPLRYSYEVTLNSAASLQVSAAISSDTGESLGSGGPWSHSASGSSPERSSALSWTERPAAVTLTLTGTYDEKGVTKTLTATQTLTAPEKPFEPPTLVIETARSLPTEMTFLYSYTVDLKDAASLTVNASFDYVDDSLGIPESYQAAADGPYAHDASLTTEIIEVASDEYPPEFPVTLTLTGSYLDKDGAEQTLTVTKVLEGFASPELWVLSANRDSTDPDLIRWSGELWTNDAEQLELYVSIGTETDVIATEGPFSYTDHAELTDRTIRADGYAEEELLLTVTGSYELYGKSREVHDYGYVDAIPFEAPEIIPLSVERGAGGTVLYEFGVNLNSAAKLDVTAYFYDGGGNQIYRTDAPIECGGYGPYSGSCVPGNAAVRIRLEGEYEHLGSKAYVEAWDDVPILAVDPTITGLRAVVNDFESWSEATLSYSYHLDTGTASNVRVKAALTGTGGRAVSDEQPETSFSASDDFAATVSPLYLAEIDDSVNVTLTCTYEQQGTAGSFTQTVTVPISMKPAYFGFSSEYYSETPGELLIWLYAGFEARGDDPHQADYDFELVSFTVEWFNASGTSLGTADLSSAAAASLTIEFDAEYRYYTMNCDLSAPIPDNAASLRFALTMRDRTTGKTYSDVGERTDLE